MTSIYNLPDGPTLPRYLRLAKFIPQSVNQVEDFAKVYGDNFTIQNRGGQQIVYFSHPQALEEIFTADPSCFQSVRGNRGLGFLLGDNSCILLNGDLHQSQRQLFIPPFYEERMGNYGQINRKITQEVSNEWIIGKPVNIHLSMQEISLRVILRLVFGADETAACEELGRLITSLLDLIASPLMSSTLFFFMGKDLGAWSPGGRVVRLLQQIDKLIYTLIQKRRVQSGQYRQDILSLLISARDQNGAGISDIELRDELMTILVTGHQTTASALTWAFYWLGQLPEVREKLQRELETININTESSKIIKLPYLTAVCQETLRVYPILVNGFPQTVKTPIKIMGYQLPIGTIIVPSIYLAHHRQQTYSEPQKFRPERFLERQFSPYEYLPFGGGNRPSIGLAFAQDQMKIALATILAEFELSLVNQKPVYPVRRSFTLAAPSRMQMIPTVQVKTANIPVNV